jgi:hypothetical protein
MNTAEQLEHEYNEWRKTNAIMRPNPAYGVDEIKTAVAFADSQTASLRAELLEQVAQWFEVRDFARSNVEYGFRKRFAAEVRELAKSDMLIGGNGK